MDRAAFFLMIAAIAGVAGAAIWLVRLPLRRVLDAELVDTLVSPACVP